jgi:hypothetical protein
LPFKLPSLEFGLTSKVIERERYRTLIDNVDIDKSIDKKVVWLHNLQTHYPIRFTADGRFDEQLTPDGVYGEMVDAFTMTGQFVDKLKQFGIYDNSLIIVFGDHGHPSVPFTSSLTEDQSFVLRKFHDVSGYRLGLYHPLLMVKPPRRTGMLEFNDNAHTLIDFRKTLNEFMTGGVQSDFYGINLLNFTKNVKQRIVLAFAYTGNNYDGRNDVSTEKWDISEIALPMDEHYAMKQPATLKAALTDLLSIKNALEEYRYKNDSYPLSQGFDGLYSKWGYSGPDWIKGMVPEYLPRLPRDLRNNADANQQYLYFSDGRDYKLISHHPVSDDIQWLKFFNRGLIDPARPHWAFGYWTEGSTSR